MNVTQAGPEDTRGAVYIVDDTRADWTDVPSDNWCYIRQYAAVPWYHGPRHFPVMLHTVAPQMSCLYAKYRTSQSLFGERLPEGSALEDGEVLRRAKVKWLNSMWFVDMDYPKTSHNNDFIVDVYWILDAQLFQRSMDLQRSPAMPADPNFPGAAGRLFEDGPRHLYTPQEEWDFVFQTSRDVNRLVWALILQLDGTKLYPDLTEEELHTPPPNGTARMTAPMFEAYPEFKKNEQFLFHKDLRKDPNVDLVCTSRFTAGPKRYDGAHERVCRDMRDKGYKLFGLPYPPTVVTGQLRHPRPAKRIIILQRHITRSIRNIDELYDGLKKALGPYGVEVEIVSTAQLQSAEENVRVFARAGVVISSHGSHLMGQIWMQKHRYVDVATKVYHLPHIPVRVDVIFLLTCCGRFFVFSLTQFVN